MIREAVLEDINKNLLNCYIEAFQYHYENRKDNFKELTNEELKESLIKDINENKLFVYDENNQITGYILTEIKEKKQKVLWISQLGVDSNFQGRGIAKKLMAYTEAYAQKQHCQKVELCCWSFNKKAASIYKHLNYNEQRIIFEKNI